MKLRTQLAIAFLFLAVVPLTAVTVYSYLASLRAFRRAVEAEAGALAEDMGTRMEASAEDLSRRLERLGDPLTALAGKEAESPQQRSERLKARLEAELGEAAGLVESVEFAPVAPPPAVPAVHAAEPAPAAGRHLRSPEPPEAPERIVVVAPPVPPEGHPVAKRDWVIERYPALPPEPVPPPAVAAEQRQAALEAISQAIEKKAEEVRERAEQEAGKDEAARAAVKLASALTRRAWAAHREEMKRVLGREFAFTIRRDGRPVGTVQAKVRAPELVRSTLSRTRRRQGELPFAIDADGRLYTADPADQPKVESLSPAQVANGGQTTESREGWMIVKRRDPASGLTLGIARPVGQALQQIRRTAVLNLVLGLGAAGLAFLGILPLSRRMTRNLEALTEGVDRLAQGDLGARVPVRSRDELGRLAEHFNRMAQDMRARQDELLEKERLRKELEMCRRIQEELLPHGPLRFPFAEVRGVSIPARELGGDFFNYFVLGENEVAVLVGDVSGKGVPAALLMANLQATLRARLPLEKDLASLAEHLDREIDATTPPEAYLTLFMGIMDARAHALRYVNAGHNTQYLIRASGGLVSLESTGRPLGLYPGGGYEERRVSLEEGDCLFLFTDGLVEAENEAGEAFGQGRLPALLLPEQAKTPQDILARVETAVKEHRGRAEPGDDATMLALKVGPPSGG